jgi:hypothetical protein
MPEPLPSYRELTLDFSEFPFGCPEGVWRARLVAKAWGKRRNILLYFRELETNRGHCISVFDETHHSPENRSFDFRYMGKVGQIFELETGKTRTGRTRFLSARCIDEPEQPAHTATQEALTPAS